MSLFLFDLCHFFPLRTLNIWLLNGPTPVPSEVAFILCDMLPGGTTLIFFLLLSSATRRVLCPALGLVSVVARREMLRWWAWWLPLNGTGCDRLVRLMLAVLD